MRMIEVCIGSACHLKGSRKVIECFKSLISENSLAETVDLKSAFCLGVCGSDVSVRIDGGAVESVSPETSEQYFRDKIMEGACHEVHRI